MPTYVYQCAHCLEVVELRRRIRDRAKAVPCPTGDGHICQRAIGLEGPAASTDYLHPILSTRMGVNPNQVAEHRRRFPKIPMTDSGEIIVTSGVEERRINKELASVFRPE